MAVLKRRCPLVPLFLLSAVVFSVSGKVFNARGPEIRSYKEDESYAARSAYFRLSLLKTMKFVGKIRYTLGQRIVGDRMLSEMDGGENYPTARNVEVVLKYPDAGTGSTLTHISIMVDQTSSSGGAYVVDGGIHDEHIKLLVVANSTTKFLYSAVFYGY